MIKRCPHCFTRLDQLGTVQDHGGTKRWTGENLYRCSQCPFGSNRFALLDGQIVPIQPTAAHYA